MEYFINKIEQLESIESEFDCRLVSVEQSKYTNFKQYSDRKEGIHVFLMPKKELKTFNDLRNNIHLISESVALDVLVRINDWVLSGGSIEDDYVKRQIQYASNFIKNN